MTPNIISERLLALLEGNCKEDRKEVDVNYVVSCFPDYKFSNYLNSFRTPPKDVWSVEREKKHFSQALPEIIEDTEGNLDMVLESVQVDLSFSGKEIDQCFEDEDGSIVMSLGLDAVCKLEKNPVIRPASTNPLRDKVSRILSKNSMARPDKAFNQLRHLSGFSGLQALKLERDGPNEVIVCNCLAVAYHLMHSLDIVGVSIKLHESRAIIAEVSGYPCWEALIAAESKAMNAQNLRHLGLFMHEDGRLEYHQTLTDAIVSAAESGLLQKPCELDVSDEEFDILASDGSFKIARAIWTAAKNDPDLESGPEVALSLSPGWRANREHIVRERHFDTLDVLWVEDYLINVVSDGFEKSFIEFQKYKGGMPASDWVIVDKTSLHFNYIDEGLQVWDCNQNKPIFRVLIPADQAVQVSTTIMTLFGGKIDLGQFYLPLPS